MNLTEEDIKAIKEDIQRGLSPKQICMKYHISPVQYSEIKDSMRTQEAQDNISENRPSVVRTHRHRRSVSFPGLIFGSISAYPILYNIQKGDRTGTRL
jgi:hypothetical protein